MFTFQLHSQMAQQVSTFPIYRSVEVSNTTLLEKAKREGFVVVVTGMFHVLLQKEKNYSPKKQYKQTGKSNTN